ncbi:hypothetical protein B0H66DRAFT_295486 [Apodospora peruviana]|uniref:Uncharacterized protein n=1 Tax=Apodospora peruviana TaxID=516989 RepID=A0AAE0I0Q2_9PEZI|nr:hypothetical protein B0H66DRAFT_295486 [Apodospora peruviana]
MLDQALIHLGDREAAEDNPTLSYACALEPGGRIDQTENRPRRAIAVLLKAMKIRRRLLGKKDPLVSYSFNHLAEAYNAAEDVEGEVAARREAQKFSTPNA